MAIPQSAALLAGYTTESRVEFIRQIPSASPINWALHKIALLCVLRVSARSKKKLMITQRRQDAGNLPAHRQRTQRY
ncbi:hypothetical protein AT746_01860 [Lacimicrobium alkaliphilum]|uniref:Uncharacterized protein n=1 Tax=Lacimicrobium alkaliphilum TaxID=1526571 RepID=A0A0U2RIU7_9ALTE|nr:hypothetical protein AT746_01860 [Lacimicrobium alkaliphilum]